MPRASSKQKNVNLPAKSGDTLETLKKGLALIVTFDSDVPELTINDAAERVGISRASARRILITLCELGYVAQRGRVFHLTPAVLNLGLTYFASQSYSRIAIPILHAVSDEIEEPSTLAVLDNFNIVHIASAEPRSPVMRISHNVGRTMPAHATAAGRVMLAGFDDDEIEKYLKTTKFSKFTDQTKSDINTLRLEIGSVQKKEYSLVVNELAYGIASMAVPVFDINNKPTAALGVGMFHGRNLKEMVNRYLPVLRSASDELSQILRKCKGVPD